MIRPVLIVLHQEQSTAGRVGHYFQAHGIPLDIRRPRFGDPLPDTLAAHLGAVIFGGPMSVNDPDDFLRTEIEWIRVPLCERKPFLGICLGSQMLARHLGATVRIHPEGKVEVGYYPIRITPTAQSLMETWPAVVYQWHREGFDLPAGADLLAEGEIFKTQAFRHGPSAFGIQFHAEVTHAMMCQWTTRGHARLALPGAKPRNQHFADRPVYDLAIRTWLYDFLDRWCALGRDELAHGSAATPSGHPQRVLVGAIAGEPSGRSPAP
jgi:GMP synthase (glutamine-hydrolysing)